MSTTVNRERLTEPFDHGAVTGWPEYRAAATAIQRLAQRLDVEEKPDSEGNPSEEDVLSLEKFVAVVRDLAVSGRIFRSCDRCRKEAVERADYSWVESLMPPVRLSRTDNGWCAVYWCPDCDRTFRWHYSGDDV